MFPVIRCKKNRREDNPVFGDIVRLQRKHKAVWLKNFRPGKRWIVEQLFGLVKGGWVPLRGMSDEMRDKELLCHIIRYNMERGIQLEVMQKTNF